MEELSLSMAEVERRSRLSKNTIANAIYGPRHPQAKTIEILAEALEMPVEELTRMRRRGGATDPLSFRAWLGSPSGRIDLWVAASGAAATAVFLYRGLRAPGAEAVVPAIHCLVLLALLTQLPRVADPVAEEDPRLRMAWAAAGDLRRYWGGAWSFWVLLYLGLTATAALDLPSAGGSPAAVARWASVGLNLLQNATTVMLLLAYEVVARPTVREDLSRRQLLPVEAWLVFALLVSVVEGTSVLVGIPWVAQQWLGWASGFAQGTALALLVGRLDSKYIGPPAPLVALLYFYAAIQGAWPALQQHPQLMLVLTFLALVLKCLLFLFVAWLFESRTLVFYLARVRALDTDVARERAEFLRRLAR
jgi:hypothetical protein